MQAFFLFSHQLFADVVRQPRHTVIFLMEDARLFRPRANPATAVFHRAALQAIRERLLVKGFPVEYMGIDEYPRLEDALTHVAKQHPEVARFFALGDTQLARQLHSLLKKYEIQFQELPSPALRVHQAANTTLVPIIFPPVEPNRYVLDAVTYVSNRLAVQGEFEFAYPVTAGDAEEWIEALPGLLDAGHRPLDLLRDLAPLLNTGLINSTLLQNVLTEAGIQPPQRRALLSLLM